MGQGWHAQLICAPGDGVQPAVLLHAGSHQYLFNVPEGFSRLVLEHKCRPGTSLRAVCTLGLLPGAEGGLSGLLLRLKADGHAQLRLLGPPGTCGCAYALRYSIYWEHPRVLASDCHNTDPSLVYQDESLDILALMGSPPVWPCPAWLKPTHADDAQHASSQTGPDQHADANKTAHCSLQADAHALSATAHASLSKAACSVPEEESEADAGYSSASASDSDAAELSHRKSVSARAATCVRESPAADPGRCGHAQSGQLETLTGRTSTHSSSSSSSSGGGSSSSSSSDDESADSSVADSSSSDASSSGKAASDMSQREPGTSVFAEPTRSRQSREGIFCALDQVFAQGRASAPNALLRLSALEVLQQQRLQASAVRQPETGAIGGVAVASSRAKRKAPAAATPSAAACAPQLIPPKARASQQVSYGLMPGSSNALYVKKAGNAARTANTEASMPAGADAAAAPFWGYLCRMRGHDSQLLLLVSCQDTKALKAARIHPVMGHLTRISNRVAAVLHLTPFDMAGSQLYRQWLKSLPGKQVLLSHGEGQQEPGHVHAACAQLQLASSAASSNFLPPHSLSWLATRHQGQSKVISYRNMRDTSQALAGQLLMSIGADAKGLYASRELCPWADLQGGSDPTAGLDAEMGHKSPLLAVALAKRLSEGQHSAGSNQPAAKRLKATLGSTAPPTSDSSAGADTAGRPHGAMARPAPVAQSMPPVSFMPVGPASRQRMLLDDYRPMCLQAAAEVRVTFLGTGAAEPSKHRAPSAIHVQVRDDAGLLLDCGEGTWGAFLHFWGPQQALLKVSQLQVAWVSHKHADHMMGLAGILHARPASTPPLLVIGPAAVRGWLQESAPHMGLRYNYVPCTAFCHGRGHPPVDVTSLLAAIGIRHWQSIPVKHCRDAWGMVVRAHAGWSIAYSGDTRPCPAFCQAARGVTLLIHEATFENDLQQHAEAKSHSTVDEAVQMTAETGAYRTLLTHFSQRYPHLPAGIPTAGAMAGRVAAAFDGMSVCFAELPALAALNSVMQAVFSDQQADNCC